MFRNKIYRSRLIKTKDDCEDCEATVDIKVIKEHIIGTKYRSLSRLIISRVICNGDAMAQTIKSIQDKLMIP